MTSTLFGMWWPQAGMTAGAEYNHLFIYICIYLFIYIYSYTHVYTYRHNCPCTRPTRSDRRHTGRRSVRG